jgi:hypothetical protein
MINLDKKIEMILGINIKGKEIAINTIVIEMAAFITIKRYTIGIINQNSANIHLVSVLINSLNK